MEIYFVQPIVESSFDFHQSFAFAFYNGEWDASFFKFTSLLFSGWVGGDTPAS